MLWALILAYSSAAAETIERGPEAPTVGWAETDLFQVLDVNGKHAAVKVIFHHTGEEPDPTPHSCGYGGMEAWPTSGVVLAVVELATGVIEPFVVYAPAWDAEGCLTEEASKAALAKAKARISAVGLDLGRKPEPVEVPLTTTTKQGEVDDDAMKRTVVGEIRRGDDVLYRTQRTYDLRGAGTGTVSFPSAFKTDDGIVFVEHFHAFSGFDGNHHAYTLTPPL